MISALETRMQQLRADMNRRLALMGTRLLKLATTPTPTEVFGRCLFLLVGITLVLATGRLNDTGSPGFAVFMFAVAGIYAAQQGPCHFTDYQLAMGMGATSLGIAVWEGGRMLMGADHGSALATLACFTVIATYFSMPLRRSPQSNAGFFDTTG